MKYFLTSLTVLTCLCWCFSFSLASEGSKSKSSKTKKIMLGVNTEQITSDTKNALKEFSQKTKFRPSIVMYYQDWNENWSTALLNPRVTNPIQNIGAIPMITWEPCLDTGEKYQSDYQLAKISRGDYDDYIRRAAREARKYNRPFYLRLAHEMNGRWSSWSVGANSNTSRDYIQMWRHVVRIFNQEKAYNARFVWSPNVYGENGVAPFQKIYPGNRWVDVVALDGYNFGKTSSSSHYSFKDLFLKNYYQILKLSSYKKPVFIGETSSSEENVGEKARWIKNMEKTIKEKMPRLRALIWFDRLKERDWRVDSSLQTLKAFKKMTLFK